MKAEKNGLKIVFAKKKTYNLDRYTFPLSLNIRINMFEQRSISIRDPTRDD